MNSLEQDIRAEEVDTPELSRAGVGKALFALGMGGFAIGTGEFVIMGLLPDAAKGLGVSIPSAGHLISIYALGVVIGAPLLAILGARWPRRNFLMILDGPVCCRESGEQHSANLLLYGLCPFHRRFPARDLLRRSGAGGG
ncbi:MFS family permease [Ewingella americana]